MFGKNPVPGKSKGVRKAITFHYVSKKKKENKQISIKLNWNKCNMKLRIGQYNTLNEFILMFNIMCILFVLFTLFLINGTTNSQQRLLKL